MKQTAREPFTENVITAIHSIPAGYVSTYGRIAELAGNPSGARQVARILHSCSRKEGLPWHRIINREGKISLPQGNGYERQRRLLEEEGVIPSANGKIDLAIYLYTPV